MCVWRAKLLGRGNRSLPSIFPPTLNFMNTWLTIECLSDVLPRRFEGQLHRQSELVETMKCWFYWHFFCSGVCAAYMVIDCCCSATEHAMSIEPTFHRFYWLNYTYWRWRWPSKRLGIKQRVDLYWFFPLILHLRSRQTVVSQKFIKFHHHESGNSS